MKLSLANIATRRTRSSPMDVLVTGYLDRCSAFFPTTALAHPAEDGFLAQMDSRHRRTPTHLILLDPRGKLLSSEAFAAHLGRQRDAGTQTIVLAVGPADGWTDAARARTDLLLSLGPMTLPHELARVVLAEQVYRALTILAGHPYHTGH